MLQAPYGVLRCADDLDQGTSAAASWHAAGALASSALPQALNTTRQVYIVRPEGMPLGLMPIPPMLPPPPPPPEAAAAAFFFGFSTITACTECGQAS